MSDFWVHRELLYYIESGIEKGSLDHKQTASIDQDIQNFKDKHDQWIEKDFSVNEGDIRDLVLEEKYKELLSDPDFKTSFSKMANEKGINVLQNNILKSVNSNLNSNESIEDLIRVFNNGITQLSENQKISKNKLQKIINSLDKIMNTKLPNNGDEDEITSQIAKKQKMVQESFVEIKRYIETILSASSTKEFINIDSDEVRQSIQGLNKIIKELDKISILTSSTAQGIIGEMVTAAMSYSLSTGNKQIEDNFFDDIQKMVAGDGIVSIKRDRQSGQIIDSYSAKKGQITGEIKVDLSGYDEKHVNKTDVYIYDYNERNNLNNKNITNASIKNYRSYNGLTLVDGTPLYNIMSNYGYDFVAHYGNLLPRSRRDQLRSNEEKFSQEEKRISNYRVQMQRIILESSLRVALMGYTNNNVDMPELFIVFNSNNPEDPVRVFRTGPLLEKIISDLRKRLNVNLTRGTARIKEKKSITTNVSYNIPLNMKMPGGMEANKYNQVKEAFEKHKVHLQISVNSIK